MRKARLLKKQTLFISSTLLIILFFLPQAQAHELKTDSTISVLLHINPDDDPIVGQSSELLFLINDTDKKFSPENCNCQASVSQNNQELFSSPLFQGKTSYAGIFAPAIPYSFPQKGIYTIVLTGRPKDNAVFQPFSMSYDVRVERDNLSVEKSSHSRVINGAIVALILGGIIYILKKFFIDKNK